MEDVLGVYADFLEATSMLNGCLLTCFDVNDNKDASFPLENLDLTMTGGKNGRLFAAYQKPRLGINYTKTITLYNSKFDIIETIFLDKRYKNIDVFVTEDNHVIVATYEGDIYVFVHFNKAKKITTHQKIKKCCFWEKGLVFLSEDNTLFVSHNFEEPEELCSMDIIGEKNINCFKIIPPEKSSDKKPIVFASDYDNSLFVAGNGSVFETKMPDQISFMEISPDNSMICFLLSNYQLIVTSSDLKSNILGTKLFNDEPVFDLAWCGSGAPIVLYANSAEVILNDGSPSIFYIDGKGYIVTYDDCAYLYTTEKTSRIFFVPDCMNDIRPKNPSGKLIDCYAHSDYFHLNKLKESRSIEAAVNSLLECAPLFSDSNMQKLILLAADFGRNFTDEKYGEKFSEVIKQTKAMNNIMKIAKSVVDIEDFKRKEAIIRRVASIGEFGLASAIAKDINVSQDVVLEEYFTRCIMSCKDDERVLELIKTKITGSFDTYLFAKKVIDMGRRDLAMSFASLSTSYYSVVNFFIEEKKWTEAINSSVSSCDSRLLSLVINKMKENDAIEDLVGILSENNATLEYYLGNYPNPDIVLDMAVHKENHRPLIHSLMSKVDSKATLGELETARDSIKKITGSKKDSATKMLNFQIDVMTKTSSNKSLNDELRQMMKRGNIEAAIKRGKECGKSEKEVIMICSKYAIDENHLKFLEIMNEKKYSNAWSYIVALLCVKDKRRDAQIFVNTLPKCKEQEDLEMKLQDDKYPISMFGDKSLYNAHLF